MIIETEIGLITIREAEVNDASLIVQFMNWVTGEVDYHTYGPGDFSIRPEDEERMIEIFKARKNSLFLIALFNDEIVAVATLSGGIKERVSHRGTVGITVAKRFWRLGIGKAMMNEIVNFSKEGQIITKIELLVHQDNIPALQLYKHLGFHREGLIKRYFNIEGQYYDGIRMGLILD